MLVLLSVHHVQNSTVQNTTVHENLHTTKGGVGRGETYTKHSQHEDDPEKSLLCPIKGSLRKYKGESDVS